MTNPAPRIGSRHLPRWTATVLGGLAYVAIGLSGCSSSSSNNVVSSPDASLSDANAVGARDAGLDANGTPLTDGGTNPDTDAMIQGVDVLTASPNCTLVQGPADVIVDTNFDRWTLGAEVDAGRAVERNGSSLAMTGDTLELFYIGSTVYREDNIGEWFRWTGSAWATATDQFGSCIGDSGLESAPTHDAGAPSSRLTAKPTGSTTSPNGYWEYLPPNYDKNTPLPTLIFIVGVGEEGDQMNDPGGLPLITTHGYGPGYEIAQNTWSNDRPFIVLMPQYTLPSNHYCPQDDQVHDFITWAIANYNIDPKRLFLTAVSCGAIGSWDYIVKYKDAQIAAAVLLSGAAGGGPAAGCGIDQVAIWSFHGSIDGTVSFPADETEMEMLFACAQPRGDMQFSPVTNVGHDIWEPIYSLSGGYGDIYQWLLLHAKP